MRSAERKKVNVGKLGWGVTNGWSRNEEVRRRAGSERELASSVDQRVLK